MKLIKAMNEAVDNQDTVLDKTEEEKGTGTKGSSGSADQNLFLNLMKKSHSASRSNSNNQSDNQNDKLSNFSDLRNNSNNSKSPRLPNLHFKTISSNRKDSEETLKTANVDDKSKYNGLTMDIKTQQRSKSFSKP
jgi:hypothetical protein